MKLGDFMEMVIQGGVQPVPSPTEGDYRATWLKHDVGAESPLLAAALGGAIADRLAWVFVAGYQAAIRHSFPELPAGPGWCAFVNAEDRTGVLPGTSLTGPPGERRLSGWKTWVAAAGHVDLLLVSAQQDKPPFVAIVPGHPGVSVDRGQPKSFLAEMAQGPVRFEDVAVSEDQALGDESTFASFRMAETIYIRTAVNAFVRSQARRLGGPASLAGGAAAGLCTSEALLELGMQSRAAAVALVGLYNHTRWLAAEFEGFVRWRDEALYLLWDRDNRLVQGSPVPIEARAASVLAGASVR